MSEKAENIISYCTSCNNDNNHEVLFKAEISGDENYQFHRDYLTIKCLGCDSISFRDDFHDIESSFPNDNDEWEIPLTSTVYPPFLKNHKGLEYSYRLPESINTVYRESIKAFEINCKLLAGAGFRAIIEAICIEKEIKGRTLEIKINNLSKDGLITKKECERLHSIRFLGNDSIHEMKVPQEKQLKVVLNIIEHILSNIYLIDYEVDSNLEKPINEYVPFKKLLAKKLKEYASGDVFPLVKFLDKDVRRVKDNFVQFEKDLVAEINAGTYDKLSIGVSQPYSGSTGNVQHYIVK